MLRINVSAINHHFFCFQREKSKRKLSGGGNESIKCEHKKYKKQESRFSIDENTKKRNAIVSS